MINTGPSHDLELANRVVLIINTNQGLALEVTDYIMRMRVHWAQSSDFQGLTWQKTRQLFKNIDYAQVFLVIFVVQLILCNLVNWECQRLSVSNENSKQYVFIHLSLNCWKISVKIDLVLAIGLLSMNYSVSFEVKYHCLHVAINKLQDFEQLLRWVLVPQALKFDEMTFFL